MSGLLRRVCRRHVTSMPSSDAVVSLIIRPARLSHTRFHRCDRHAAQPPPREPWRGLTLTEEAAVQLADMSQVFFADEVQAAAQSMTSGERAAAGELGLLGQRTSSRQAPLPLLLHPSDKTRPDNAGAAADAGQLPRENGKEGAQDGASDDWTSLMMLDWVEQDGDATAPPSPQDSATPVAVAILKDEGGAAALTAPLSASNGDPAHNLFQLMTLGSRGAREEAASFSSSPAASSPAVMRATELLLQGLDVKAIVRDNTIEHVRLENKCMSQSDFSFTAWHDVHAVRCDFSLSVFHKGVVRGPCAFHHCTFDGSVLNGLRIAVDCDTAADERDPAKEGRGRPSVRFEGCTFRRCALGLVCGVAHDSATSGPAVWDGGALFVNCDFDLATFEGSVGLSAHPEAFQGCRNTQTAAKFLLRARAV